MEKRETDSLLLLAKKRTEENRKLEAENKRINELNAESRKRYNAAITAARVGELQEIESALQLQSLLKPRDEQMRERMQDAFKSNEIIRSFSINRFGIWNCDHPEYPNLEISITAGFKNQSGDTLALSNVSVVYKSFIGVTQFFAPNIRVIPGQPNMLWAIYKDEFYYFSNEEYSKSNIDRNTRQYLFRMQKSGKKISSYEDMKDLVNGLK
jgi:hypothetical protein